MDVMQRSIVHFPFCSGRLRSWRCSHISFKSDEEGFEIVRTERFQKDPVTNCKTSENSLTSPPPPWYAAQPNPTPTPDDVCGTPWSRRSRVFAQCSSAMHYPLTCLIAQVVQSWIASWILRTRIPLTTALTCKAPRQTCKLPTDNTPAFRKLSKLIRFFPSGTFVWNLSAHIAKLPEKLCSDHRLILCLIEPPLSVPLPK